MTLSRGRAVAGALLLGMLWLSGCASSASSKEEEVRRLRARALYEQGLRSLADHQASPALSAFKEAVQLDPENANYHNVLGVVYLEIHQPADAETEFRKAVELDPGYGEAIHNLGLSFAEQGRYEDAIVQYRKAISMPVYPTPEVGYYNLGRAYVQINKPREAEDALRMAIRLDPKLGAAYYQLGVVLASTGRRDEAREIFRRARDLDPASPSGQAAAEALKTLGEGG
jgi:type IV pilus assembly protein PilF